MQLDKPSLCAALAAATGALLGHSAPSLGVTWQADNTLMVYEEQDGIRSVSPSIEISRRFKDGKKLSLALSYDSLSGASASGASGAAQTVTSPSGTPVQITAGSGLVMAPFEDERQALNLNWEARLDEKTGYVLGASYSKEVDFAAASINGQLNRNFFKKNLTLALGAAYEQDTINPVGGTPQSFSLNGGSTPKGGSEQRRQMESLLSASLVLSPRTIAYFAWGMSRADGYLTDPYKVITVVDPTTGKPIDGIAFDDQLAPNEKKANLYEKRPAQRLRQSLFAEVKQAWARDVLTFNYRYTQDDWQINTHTIEGDWHWQLSEQIYLQPNVRWYRQSAAYFYRYSLVNFQDISGPLVNVYYASADRRLAAFDATTAGVRLGWTPDKHQNVSLRLTAYQQRGDSHPDTSIGAEKAIDFFPRQRAWWLQLLYSRQW